MAEDFNQAALEYHRRLPKGKLEVIATKPLATQRDLSLAYSPGVAAACDAIVENASDVSEYTARANLVGVISNGTAVLGLGDIGPLASKPVMEGKAVLFKKFAGVNVFDIEIDEKDPDKLVDIIASLEPTFGGINLEDIAAPHCFEVEKQLKERCNIPIFHDDQHGTAIIVAAAVRNALSIVNKKEGEVKLVASGAGAAAIACLNLLVFMGIKRENIFVTDIEGVVYEGRTVDMDPYKSVYAQKTEARTLSDVIAGADIFLGVSAAGVLKPEMVKQMAEKPIILALANPNPEILPEEARAVRSDAIIATGRSDYPNQVNNVLCFPFLFRGALDVGATAINEEMKIAAVDAIAGLAKQAPTEEVDEAYGTSNCIFGPDNLIPKPFDPRLIMNIAPAVAKAAMDSGVATRPIEDFSAYRAELEAFVYKSGSLMKPVYSQAKAIGMKRVVFAEGERRKTLQAVEQVISQGLARPLVIGRPEMVRSQIKKIGLRIEDGRDYDIINPFENPHFKVCWQEYHRLMGRKGVSPAEAKHRVTTQPVLLGALMVKLNLADGLLAGTVGNFTDHLDVVRSVTTYRSECQQLSSMMALFLPSGTYFMSDTHVAIDPDSNEIADMTKLVAREVRRFGIEPKIALLSRSNFGNVDGNVQATKMRTALAKIRQDMPDLEIDGEMHADAALSEEIRSESMPDSPLKGSANTLIMPRADAAHISYNLLKMLGGGVAVGPILIGSELPIHLMTNSCTVTNLVNMTALVAVHAEARERRQKAI